MGLAKKKMTFVSERKKKTNGVDQSNCPENSFPISLGNNIRLAVLSSAVRFVSKWLQGVSMETATKAAWLVNTVSSK